MSTKKQYLSPKARKLIDEFDKSAGWNYWAQDRGTGNEVLNAGQAYERDQAALETYVLHLERKARRLKDELNRMTMAYKLLLNKAE